MSCSSVCKLPSPSHQREEEEEEEKEEEDNGKLESSFIDDSDEPTKKRARDEPVLQ
jgi:hypothetical protein